MNRVGWTITFEGEEYRESDLTVGDAVRALDLVGDSDPQRAWTKLHPLSGPAYFVALLAVLLETRGVEPEKALAVAGRVNMVEALSMVSVGEGEAGD